MFVDYLVDYLYCHCFVCQVAVPQPSSLRTTVVTISSDTHSSNNMDEEEDEEEEKPSMKKPRLSSPQPPVPASLHTAAAGMINNASLSNPEVSAVRQLIIGKLQCIIVYMTQCVVLQPEAILDNATRIDFKCIPLQCILCSR